MCGIFGVIGKQAVTKSEQDFISDAFLTDQVRGRHGTGVFMLDWQHDVTIHKAAVDGGEFLDMKQTGKLAAKFNRAHTIIGHNRHTTSGKNVDDHCHPFQFGDVVGVHNGGVGEHVLSRFDSAKSHEVDSARIYAGLSRTEDPLSVLRRMHAGNYALVWYDARTKSMHLARNGGRPLAVAETGTHLYLASEMGMLTWLMSRNNSFHQDCKVAELDSHTLYTIPLATPEKVTAQEYTSHAPAVKTTKKATTKKADTKDDENTVPTSLVKEGAKREKFWSLHTIEDKYAHLAPLTNFLRDTTLVYNGVVSGKRRAIIVASDEVDSFTTNLIGLITNEDCNDYEDGVFCSIRSSKVLAKEVMDNLPTREEALAGTDGYPIIDLYVNSYDVLPTGEIVVLGRPGVKPAGEPLYTVIDVVDQHMADWADYATCSAYLEPIDQTGISIMWTEMAFQSAEYLDEMDDEFGKPDIPF